MKAKPKNLHRFSARERGDSVGGFGVSVAGLEYSKHGFGNTNRQVAGKDTAQKTCEGFKVLPSHCFAMKINRKRPLCEAVKVFSGFKLRI